MKNFQMLLTLDLVSFFKLFKGDVKDKLNNFVEKAKEKLSKHETLTILPAGSGFEDLFLTHIDGESGCNQVNTDADFMMVQTEYDIIEDVQGTVLSENLCSVEECETANNNKPMSLHMKSGSHDGYVCLSYNSDGGSKEKKKYYLQNFKFIEECRKSFSLTSAVGEAQSLQGFVKGPSFQEYTISSLKVNIDWVFAIKCNFWPSQANEWIHRSRSESWPSDELLKNVISNGCHLVPVDSHNSTLPGMEWRISFSLAELTLIKSMEEDLKFAYCILKLVIKFQMNALGIDIFASYHLKTALFWYLEAYGEHKMKTLSTIEKVYGLLDMLMKLYSTNCISNYFVRTNNMIDHCSSDNILSALKCLKDIHLNLGISLYGYIDKHQKLPVMFDDTTLQQSCSMIMFTRACKYHFLVMSLIGLLIDSKGEKNYYSYRVPVQEFFQKSKFLHELHINDGDDNLEEICRQYLCLSTIQSEGSVTITEVLKLLSEYLCEDCLKVTESSAVALGVFNIVLAIHPDTMRFSKCDFLEVLLWSATTHEIHCDAIYEFVLKEWKDPPLLWSDDVDALKFIKLLMVVLGKPTKQAKGVTGSLLKNNVFDIFTWRGLAFYLLHVNLECAYVVFQAIAYLLGKTVFDEVYTTLKLRTGIMKQKAIDLVLLKPELQAELSEKEFLELIQARSQLDC